MSLFKINVVRFWQKRTIFLIILEPHKRAYTKMGQVPVILCDSHEFWSLLHWTPNYSASEQPITPAEKKTLVRVVSTAKCGDSKKYLLICFG